MICDKTEIGLRIPPILIGKNVAILMITNSEVHIWHRALADNMWEFDGNSLSRHQSGCWVWSWVNEGSLHDAAWSIEISGMNSELKAGEVKNVLLTPRNIKAQPPLSTFIAYYGFVNIPEANTTSQSKCQALRTSGLLVLLGSMGLMIIHNWNPYSNQPGYDVWYLDWIQ